MVNHPKQSKRDAVALSAAAVEHNHEHDYSALLSGVRASFDAIASEHPQLFLTNADGLNDLYLDSLPSERQVHTCHACKRFIGTFGNLVAITEAGDTVPAMWNPDGVPEFYRPAFAALHARVKKARVVSPFITADAVWGMPRTGDWTHISVTAPAGMLYRGRVLTAGQAMAAAKENFRTVATALAEIKPAALDEALRILNADAVARSEKFIAPVKWLRALHDRPKGRKGENVLWRATAAAPEGYCHPRASVVGTLLEDIAAGLPFEDIRAKFNAKLGGLVYQRPQAAPTAGNIKAAEALVEKMGIAPSLHRRFARLDEVQTIWKPTAPKAPPETAGVFGHLKPKASADVKPVNLPSVTMTWEKFARTILPTAEAMDFMVPAHGNFTATLTAADADAPPILKWDREDKRNPCSSYVYHGGSSAAQWRLMAGHWAGVTGISPRPNLWGENPAPHLGEGLTLILAGAADTRTGQGNALFPETLRDELHAVRSTIEAYSKHAEIGGVGDASACGYGIGKGKMDIRVRSFASGAWSEYRIDRWD